MNKEFCFEGLKKWENYLRVWNVIHIKNKEPYPTVKETMVQQNPSVLVTLLISFFKRLFPIRKCKKKTHTLNPLNMSKSNMIVIPLTCLNQAW